MTFSALEERKAAEIYGREHEKLLCVTKDDVPEYFRGLYVTRFGGTEGTITEYMATCARYCYLRNRLGSEEDPDRVWLCYSKKLLSRLTMIGRKDTGVGFRLPNPLRFECCGMHVEDGKLVETGKEDYVRLNILPELLNYDDFVMRDGNGDFVIGRYHERVFFACALGAAIGYPEDSFYLIARELFRPYLKLHFYTLRAKTGGYKAICTIVDILRAMKVRVKIIHPYNDTLYFLVNSDNDKIRLWAALVVGYRHDEELTNDGLKLKTFKTFAMTSSEVEASADRERTAEPWDDVDWEP